MAPLSGTDLSTSVRPQSWRWQVSAHVALHFAGFLVSTLLMSWGLFTLFFLALGNFSFDGLMHQLANLSSRYVAAGSERVASFKTVVVVAHLIVTTGLIILRRHKMFPSLQSQGDARHG